MLGRAPPPLAGQLDQQSPQALCVFQKAEIEKWWPLIKADDIKPE
jgi:hypothetical protein